MTDIISTVLGGFASMFYNNNAFFFYYTIALLLFLAASILMAYGSIRDELSRAKRNHLLILGAVIVAFAVVELAFVPVTVHLYSDEYIYMSMAKTMIYDHVAGICSFSTPLHCVPGTLGLFQQPVGWPLLLAVTYLVSGGVSLYGGLSAALLLSMISILLVFLIALIMFDDSRVALLSSCLFAATPLFITYSRSMVSDTPALTFFLLSIMLSLLYAKTRKATVGVAAVSAVLYTLVMKVDAVLILIVVLGFLASYWKVLLGGKVRARRILGFAAISAMFIVLALPQFAFLYNSNKYNNFGSSVGGGKFSLQYLAAQLPQDAYFFLGQYAHVTDSTGFVYYDEYPLAYTAFAMAGAALLLYYRKLKEAGALLIWFFGLFVIYTAYYAGGVLFSAGIDVRYFLSAFPAVAILASYGLLQLWSLATSASGRRARARKRAKRRERRSRYPGFLMVMLLFIAFSAPVLYFITIVIIPPQNLYAFAAERQEQQFILGVYNSVPQGCFVLTYEPTLWYVLNRSNMYADWINVQGYRSELLNMSGGCVYFVFDMDCHMGTTNPQYDNTQTGCTEIQENYAMETVATDPYDAESWNLTFGLYKVTGYSNGTAFK